MACFHVIIAGVVQGVGYRYWLRGEAERRGINGWCRNRRDGTVEAIFAGESERLDQLLERCRSGPPGAAVGAVDIKRSDESPLAGFQVLPDTD